MNAPNPRPAYISRATRRAQQRRARADELRAAISHHDLTRYGYLKGYRTLAQLQQAAVRLMRAQVPEQRARAQQLYCYARRIDSCRLTDIARLKAGRLLSHTNILTRHIATLEATPCSQS